MMLANQEDVISKLVDMVSKDPGCQIVILTLGAGEYAISGDYTVLENLMVEHSFLMLLFIR